MKHRRVTLKDIAGVAGVHHTTVSMALRNDRRLPAATRARIRQCAAELGYRPDPMLSALSSYRAAIRPLRTPSTIAFVTDVDPAEIRNGRAHGQFLSGVREGAESLGYKVDRFAVGAGIAGIRCLQRVLLNRSIRGVIIAMTGRGPTPSSADWEDFSIVAIESKHLGLNCSCVGNNQELATRDAVRQLYRLGFRRIGLAVGAEEEARLCEAFSAGYYVEKAQHVDLVGIAPFLLTTVKSVQADFSQWLRSNRVDVVLSNWSTAPDMARLAGLRVPEDVAVTSLDLPPEALGSAGIVQNHRLVGWRAVEQLDMLMRTNARGIPEFPNNIVIEALWRPGLVPMRTKERG